MKIEEAIEIKARKGEESLNTDPDEIDEADRLSIEAMKRLNNARLLGMDYPLNLLPGEDKP